MDSNIKKELIDGISQLNIKKEEKSFEFVEMAIPALKCTALTELTSNVTINSVDHENISVSGDGVTHIFSHGLKLFSVTPLLSKYRIILKQMIKKEYYVVEGNQFVDEYRFDLKVDFEKDSNASNDFLRQLITAGYNAPPPPAQRFRNTKATRHVLLNDYMNFPYTCL